MRHIAIFALFIAAAMTAFAKTRFERLPANSNDWITGSFLREHAQCRPAMPNGRPGAPLPCIVYHIPPMPGAPSDTPYGKHFLQFEFSGQSMQLPLTPNRQNQLAYTPQPPAIAQAQNNGWTYFRFTNIGGKPISFYSNTQMLNHLNHKK
ncbi:hypothetical protein H9Q10_02670 [Eikenella sp. S3360]|uniref:Uncharacterized protein n=1 Tax=Eikenella glucosivorans TaxID=2766967 RepID=A0ABS0N8I0_9NEIS|nr:hypothetical protein [Eikenella glucosivorans]MBH5328574.1 hypothetical protein [Eikenella glucosivorans]